MTEDGTATTLLLDRWNAGEPTALGRLFAHFEPELRDIVRRSWWKERSQLTLSRTELLHELYLRLHPGCQRQRRKRRTTSRRRQEHRDHFLGYCARALEYLLKDRAKKKKACKRDGGIPIPLDEFADLGSDEKDEAHRRCPTRLVSPRHQATLRLTLEKALDELEQVSPRQHRIAVRYLTSGMTLREIAEETGLSRPLVRKEWYVAKLFLCRELRGGADPDRP